MSKACFLILLAWYISSCNNLKYEEIQIERDGQGVLIEGGSTEEKLEVIFKSIQNHTISTYKDVSPDNPSTTNKGNITNWNILYPIVDVKISDYSNTKGVVHFDTIQNTAYSINGMFFKEKKQLLGNSLTLEGTHLFEWENNLYLDSLSGGAVSFHLSTQLKKNTSGKFSKHYAFLHPQWMGDIYVLTPQKDTLTKLHILSGFESIDERTYSNPLHSSRLLASLKASIDFTLRSQNHSVNDPTIGGLNLFYDYESQAFRRSTWLWSWGPSIKMLLESSNIPEITSSVSKDNLQQVALEIGEASLKFQNVDKKSPAYGVATSRWSETKNMGDFEYDYERFYSVADGQFLAGWGWMYLYKHLGDERFLEATRLQTEATRRLVEEMGNIPMDYMENFDKWKGHMISEQGFGMEGINELHRFDPDSTYKTIGKDYLDMLLSKLDHSSGGWNRAYRIKEGTSMPPLFYVRGHGWAMEGLTAGYELTQDPTYLEKAKKMAALLMKYQMPDGGWSVVFTEQNPKELSDKGTALWSLLFYRMYRFTNNEKYLQTARKALKWCLANQYFGEDEMAHGSIPNISRASGVIYRRWFPMACNYTTAFFGLAVMEELKLQDKNK